MRYFTGSAVGSGQRPASLQERTECRCLAVATPFGDGAVAERIMARLAADRDAANP